MDILPDASVTTQEDNFTDQRFLMSYSEEEKQENEINKANAKLVFSPEFIPYRMNVKEHFKLNHVETLIYGFIRFYKSNAASRFYFTNKQIASIVATSEPNAARAIQNLIKKKILAVGYKLKAGGGKMRFVNGVTLENGHSDYANMISRTTQKRLDNKNKIKENKIKNNVVNKFTEKGDAYGQQIATMLNDKKSLTYYRLVCARYDPVRLMQKAQELVADRSADNMAAVFVSWVKTLDSP